MSLCQLNMAGLNKIEVAIKRMKEFEPPEGYYLAFSGGKDSQCIYHLGLEAGVKFDAHYSLGGIDPPELVQFIKANYPQVQRERPKISVWQGIYIHGMPRRQSRWCCELIKEQHGSGRIVMTGIRWQESPRRSHRMMFEVCRADGTKKFLHPIIDWSNKDVFEYLQLRGIAHCALYDEGLKRLGCVLCPMETARQTQFEIRRWPKLAEAWKRNCFRYWAKGLEGTKRWPTPEAMWAWWISRKSEPKINDKQCRLFDN